MKEKPRTCGWQHFDAKWFFYIWESPGKLRCWQCGRLKDYGNGADEQSPAHPLLTPPHDPH